MAKGEAAGCPGADVVRIDPVAGLTESEDAIMPQVWFAVTTVDGTRTDGVVQGGSYAEALTAVSEHVSGNIGDVLEIGVEGFPPARYLCIVAGKGRVEAWRPAGLLAA